MASASASATVSSPAQLIGAVPLPPLMKAGTLRLASGRLRFVAVDATVVVDAPVEELHSVALSATGFHVWHGDRLLRFALRRGEMGAVAPESWVAALRPLIGSPPAGARIRRPWPTWAWVMCLLIAIVVILALAAGINALAQ